MNGGELKGTICLYKEEYFSSLHFPVNFFFSIIKDREFNI